MKEVQINKAEADVLKEGIEGEEKIVKDAVNAANKIKKECSEDLAEAMPALKAAEDALKVLVLHITYKIMFYIVGFYIFRLV